MEPFVATDSNKELINAETRSCVDEYLNEQQGELQLNVSGDCMLPALKDSQLITITRHRKYYSGDIVAYYSSQYERHMVHRVLGVIPFQDSDRYFIKADNTFRPDVIVDESDILGRAGLIPISIGRRLYCFVQLQCWIIITTVNKILNGLRR